MSYFNWFVKPKERGQKKYLIMGRQETKIDVNETKPLIMYGVVASF
jgi:hypothetical protein